MSKSPIAKYYAFERNTATIDGITKTWAEWCNVYKVSRRAVYERMHYDRSRSFEDAVKRRTKNYTGWWTRPLTIDGVTKTPETWAKEAGISKNCYYQRIHQGLTVAEALTIANQAKRDKNTEPTRINKVDVSDVKGINLDLEPTPEVIAMCQSCPYADCVNMNVKKCLREKRRKEVRANERFD